MKTITTLTVPLLLSLLLFANSAGALINGKKAEPSSYAYRSSLMLLHAGFFEIGRGQCSASLIAPDLVLTAAHCVVNLKTGENIEPSKLTTYFGNYDGATKDEALVREVEKVIRHPLYIAKTDEQEDSPTKPIHDIAVIKLRGSAPSSHTPVRIVEAPELLKKDQTLVLAGFGNIYFMGDKREPKGRTLRLYETTVETPVHPISKQLEYWRQKEIETIEDYYKSVGGMAAGDSGGPAYVLIDGIPHVAGIASGYRYKDQPFYENAATHFGWIKDTARELGASPPNILSQDRRFTCGP